ncbi:MAG: decaprenyl-phosphate phosphoribosyltransferase [Sterolibacterium sp.]|jgi:4-hydroxybenzoate polyprenyltransferase|nr:decaprenyl-phosphate phosphoribosyltransferase [Sterolibacterium sp.]
MIPIKPLFRLLRPHQWLKNSFVFVGLLFGHAWADLARLEQVGWAFAAFSLLASGVYVMNDLMDREQDRLHPTKRHRPLASGAVKLPMALMLMVSCFVAGFALVAYSDNRAPWVFYAYVALNIGYTLGLKHVVVLDVFIIAAGFMLRLLAGTLGIGIAPSFWLLLCGLMLTLFLGFAKRQAESMVLDEGDAAAHRRVLEDYTSNMLDQFMTIASAATIISYSLYTVSPETVALHGSTQLIYTVPLVIYGMFRYLFLMHRRGGGGDPARQLLTDPHLLAAVAGWLLLVLAILKGWL